MDKNELTKTMYLSNPNICPFCKSNDLETEQFEVVDDSGEAKQIVSCNHCYKAWTDVYKLSDVEF